VNACETCPPSSVVRRSNASAASSAPSNRHHVSIQQRKPRTRGAFFHRLLRPLSAAVDSTRPISDQKANKWDHIHKQFVFSLQPELGIFDYSGSVDQNFSVLQRIHVYLGNFQSDSMYTNQISLSSSGALSRMAPCFFFVNVSFIPSSGRPFLSTPPQVGLNPPEAIRG